MSQSDAATDQNGAEVGVERRRNPVDMPRAAGVEVRFPAVRHAQLPSVDGVSAGKVRRIRSNDAQPAYAEPVAVSLDLASRDQFLGAFSGRDEKQFAGVIVDGGSLRQLAGEMHGEAWRRTEG